MRDDDLGLSDDAAAMETDEEVAPAPPVRGRGRGSRGGRGQTASKRGRGRGIMMFFNME